MEKRKGNNVAVIAITAMMLYGMYSLATNLSSLRDAESYNAELRGEAELLRDENERLNSLVENRNSDSSIEKLARDRLGLAKPDEIVFVDKK